MEIALDGVHKVIFFRREYIVLGIFIHTSSEQSVIDATSLSRLRLKVSAALPRNYGNK
jgi:hypothetical protein